MNQPATPTLLRPDDLAALAQWLRAHDMRIHSGQAIAAARLLAQRGQLPSPAKLAPWLAPVFCTSEAEQIRFAALYTGWLEQSRFAPEAPPPPPPPPRRKSLVQRAPVTLWAAILTLLVLLMAGLLWECRQHSTIIAVTGDGKLLRDAEIVVSKPGLWLASRDDGRQVLHYRHWSLPFKVYASDPAFMDGNALAVASQELKAAQPALELALLSPPAPPRPDTSKAAYGLLVDSRPAIVIPLKAEPPGNPDMHINAASLTGIIVVLMASLAWWLYTAARRRGFLERLPKQEDLAHMLLSYPTAPALPAYAGDLRYLSREMRRRRATPSRTLDISATLAATLRAGGMPMPVLGSRSEPDYLVMVDSTGSADHQAHLSDEVIRAFLTHGVALERYEFDGDPRFSVHAPLDRPPQQSGTQSLDTLQHRHPAARLIIFSDGNAMIDSYTGKPAAWLDCLTAWPSPVLITPQPRHLWTLREWLLASTGLVILPLDGQGLRQLSGILRHEVSRYGAGASARSRSRPAYLRETDLLLDRNALDDKALGALLDALAADLKQDGLAWLAACAVFPEIHWPVTLAVGDAVQSLPKDDRARQQSKARGLPTPQRQAHYAQKLAQLSRLPWMRLGFMPDWLRVALLNRLAPETERAVRMKLDQLLAGVTERVLKERPQAVLEIAVSPARRAWMDVWAGLRAWRTRQPAPDTTDDAIFLKFMSGPQKNLTVAAGKALVRLFYRHGVPLGGPRLWPLGLALSATAVIAVLFPPVQLFSRVHPAGVTRSRPALIAIDSRGTRMAVADVNGTVALTPIPPIPATSAASLCSTAAGFGTPYMLSFDGSGSVQLLSSDHDKLRNTTISADCKITRQMPVRLSLATGYQSGRLQTANVTSLPQADGKLLCATTSEWGTLVGLQRKFVDKVLLDGQDRAIDCAFARDGKSMVIAVNREELLRIDVSGGPTKVLKRYAAPVAGVIAALTHGEYSELPGVVMADGSLWLFNEQSWQQYTSKDASPPFAASADKLAYAYTTVAGGIDVFRISTSSIQVEKDGKAGNSSTRALVITRPAIIHNLPTSLSGLEAEKQASSAPAVNAGTTANDNKDQTSAGTSTTPATSPPVSEVLSAISSSTENGIRSLFTSTIYFDTSQRSLSRAQSMQLDQLIEKIQNIKLSTITLKATIGNISSFDEITALEQRMQQLVRNYLIAHGISADSIVTEAVSLPSGTRAAQKLEFGRLDIEVRSLPFRPEG
ncbi:hypothetical protein GTP58_06490 [Duganella sp. CY15W]|uniref:hypothetical protein n=1 Tax=Duganella sp. CY15W TaxID=2692172 RepID=UPI0013690DC6|nr:hypothetical protein [Duganella sp. CY15W]MYM27964.1 hypothetical protein [Duganella sp. CY15W]